MKNKIIKASIIFLLLTLIALFIIFTIIKNKAVYIERSPYNKDGFVKVEELSDDKEYILESMNKRFEFKLDAKTTQFIVNDNLTNQTWSSKTESLSGQANHENELSELFVLYYERKIEAPRSMSIYEESIKHDAYMIRDNKNSIDVLYEVGGKRSITFNDLPRIIPRTKVEELIYKPLEVLAESNSTVRRNLTFLKQRGFVLSEQDDTYNLRQIDSQKTIEDMYDLIFNLSDYTFEDYIEDSERYGLETEQEVPYFEFVVRYSITDKGLSVYLINESIVESVNYMISYIDILPFFGSSNLDDEGFTVIPDGSGILIDHNNNRHNSPAYNKRIYGADNTMESTLEIKPEEQETIKFPMYAYSKNNYGFINVLESGDSMTNIRSNFKTTINSGVLTNRVAQTYYRFNLRERDYFEFKASLQSHNVTMWTNEYITEDFKMQYIFLEDGSEYFNFAEEYKQYLKNTLGFEKDTTNQNTHLTFLGGYKEKKYFLGIPYNTVQALTTAKDIPNITEELAIDNYSISFQGWSNDGIKPNSYKKITFNGNVSTKKELSKLISTMNDKEIELYLEVLTGSAYSDKKLNVNKNVNKTLLQNIVKLHKYDLSTRLADFKTTPKYYLNSDYSNDIIDTISKFSDKNSVNGFVIMDQGNELSSNYAKGNVAFRNEVINNLNESLSKLENNKMVFRNASLYAMLNADKLLDLPVEGTRHRIVDYSIPFIQLTLNGLVDYFGTSVNLDTSKSLKWHELKAVETGSKVQFTLTKNDTVQLINTEYSEIFSTYYKNWIPSIQEITTNLDKLGIYNSEIINHKVLNADATIIEVEYSSGKKFTINYINETIIESGVNS